MIPNGTYDGGERKKHLQKSSRKKIMANKNSDDKIEVWGIFQIVNIFIH